MYINTLQLHDIAKSTVLSVSESLSFLRLSVPLHALQIAFWMIRQWQNDLSTVGLAKPKGEEEDRPRGGYRHSERTAGNSCVWLTATGGLCWQAKEMLSLLKEGELT